MSQDKVQVEDFDLTGSIAISALEITSYPNP